MSSNDNDNDFLAGNMREQLIEIVLDALRAQHYPDATRHSVQHNDAHRQAFLALLDDCRPLPIIRTIRRDLAERHTLAPEEDL